MPTVRRRARHVRGGTGKKKIKALTGSRMKTAVKEAVASLKSHRGVKAATVAGKVKSKYGKEALPKRFQVQVSRLLRGLVRAGKLQKVKGRFALASGKKKRRGGGRVKGPRHRLLRHRRRRRRRTRSRRGRGRGRKRRRVRRRSGSRRRRRRSRR